MIETGAYGEVFPHGISLLSNFGESILRAWSASQSLLHGVGRTMRIRSRNSMLRMSIRHIKLPKNRLSGEVVAESPSMMQRS